VIAGIGIVIATIGVVIADPVGPLGSGPHWVPEEGLSDEGSWFGSHPASTEVEWLLSDCLCARHERFFV
jgi:hypothetical protein